MEQNSLAVGWHFFLLTNMYQGTYKNVRILTMRTYPGYPPGLNCISHSLETMSATTGKKVNQQEK
jgi:hypothetical protein